MPVVVSLLDRKVYLYSEVDRIIGLRAGTAKRWINGYTRGGVTYDPILRVAAEEDEQWVTWGEFVEARILAEYRDKDIPTLRLRGAVAMLRRMFDHPYPLATFGPYEAMSGDLFARQANLVAQDKDALLHLRTGQLLLDLPGREVMRQATLADEADHQVAIEIIPDARFAGIVVNPERQSGQPTFIGRRVTVAIIAGMVEAGDDPVDLAASYGLSLAQVDAAIAYSADHKLTA